MRGRDFIRYHPLIDAGGDGMELMPLFRHGNIHTVHDSHSFFLSEMADGYYRLHCSRPLSNRQIRATAIHCPSCGNTLTGISDANASTRIYICKRCKKLEERRL